MNKIAALIFFGIALLFISCEYDLDKSYIAYTKVEPIYGNLEEVRNMPLFSPTQELINPGKVFVADDLLFIGEIGKGIHIYDNSDPENPEQKYFLNIPSNNEYYVNENYLYAESLYDVLKIDISNKDMPTLATRINNVFGVPLHRNEEVVIGFTYTEVEEEIETHYNNPEYRTISEPGFVYDVYHAKAIPRSSILASFGGNSSSTSASISKVSYNKGYLYFVSDHRIYSFADVDNFELAETVEVGGKIRTIYTQDDLLYVTADKSIEVFNIKFPRTISPVTKHITSTECAFVLPHGDKLYITRQGGSDCGLTGSSLDWVENSLHLTDLSNMDRPKTIQRMDLMTPYGMTIIDDQLYVGEGDNGLKVFDIMNDATFELVEHVTNIDAYDIIAHPSVSGIILVATPSGIGQYQISGNRKELLSWISI